MEGLAGAGAVAPQWGRSVVSKPGQAAGAVNVVRLDFGTPRDVTLYLSGLSGDGATVSRPAVYELSWGNASAFSSRVLAPVPGLVMHIAATRVAVVLRLDQAPAGTFRAQASASIGRPTVHEHHLFGSQVDAGAVHVLPFFSPRFSLPKFTSHLIVSAFGVVSGAPTVSELSSSGGVLVTRPVSAYAAGAALDPRAAQVELSGGEYDALAWARVGL